jgi:hypothetical protein
MGNDGNFKYNPYLLNEVVNIQKKFTKECRLRGKLSLEFLRVC